MDKLNINADFESVPLIRRCIAHKAMKFGFDSNEIYQIESIIDELCNNAIEHGSKTKDDIIVIEYMFTKGRFSLLIQDAGNNGFDSKKMIKQNKNRLENNIATGKLENKLGLGLIIVRKLVDELNVKSSTNGTSVSVVKTHKDKYFQ